MQNTQSLAKHIQDTVEILVSLMLLSKNIIFLSFTHIDNWNNGWMVNILFINIGFRMGDKTGVNSEW